MLMAMKRAKERKLPDGDDLRRHLEKQLRSARRAWMEKPASRDAVHMVRKRLKSVRALLRLLRPIIGDRDWRKNNRALRKIARRLSLLREAQVDWRTFKSLSLPDIPDTARLRRILQLRLDAARAGADGKEPLAKALRRAQDRMSELQLDEVSGDKLRAGLDRMRRATKLAADRARNEPTVETIHDWRKAVKNLGYVLPVLLGKRAAKEQLRALDKLGDLLGEEHDLALFEALIAGHLVGSGHDQFLARIVKHRAALREEAIALGGTLDQNWK
jgi:hypothetical protein